ncbi:MAG: Rhs family protein [Clostridiaceae bacterium]|jgi:hypothetical protein|nr:Rhs family protein [Clostridiaceae bacterium]
MVNESEIIKQEIPEARPIQQTALAAAATQQQESPLAEAKVKLWEKYLEETELDFKNVDEQISFLVDNVPGITIEQAKKLLNYAFERDSSVTLGGSRIRGNYTELSDLDAGFSNISNGQYGKLMEALNKMEGVKFEDGIKLRVGNETKNVPKIESMEEFFQRTGKRFIADSSGSMDIKPSGSVTITKDRKIKLIPPQDKGE